MSLLTAGEEASYSAIIDSILASSDLQTVSAKKIRLTLQEGIHHDLSGQKQAVNDLIQRRFDRFTADQEAKEALVANGRSSHSPLPQASTASASVSPVKREKPDDAADVIDDSPPKKRVKNAKVEDDAAYAAKLQAELNSSSRPTRGGNPKSSRPASKIKKPKRPKKISAAKISAADDSDVEAENDETKKSNRGGAFNKPMYLSQPLKDLLGEETLSRPQTVKRLWEHIREHDLQNPKDRREILCDDSLKAIFKKDSVTMFSMNKILSGHLSPLED